MVLRNHRAAAVGHQPDRGEVIALQPVEGSVHLTQAGRDKPDHDERDESLLCPIKQKNARGLRGHSGLAGREGPEVHYPDQSS